MPFYFNISTPHNSVSLIHLVNSEIFRGEAGFSYLVANGAQITVVSVLFEIQQGVTGKRMWFYFTKI